MGRFDSGASASAQIPQGSPIPTNLVGVDAEGTKANGTGPHAPERDKTPGANSALAATKIVRGVSDMLERVSGPYPWHSPPAHGSQVALNSGGPDMIVLDMDGPTYTVGWAADDGPEEMQIHWRCLRPI